MHKTKGVLLLFILLAGVFSPFFVYSEASHLVINEVLYDSSGSDLGNEWIELYNPTSEIIDLNNWLIESGGNSFSEVYLFNNVVIQPQSFLVVGEMNVLEANIQTGELGFQNGGSATDGIRIVDSDGNIIDTVLYDEPNLNRLEDDTGDEGINFAIDVSSGSSIGRDEQSSDTNNCSNDFFEYLFPTPGAENVVVLPNESPIAIAGSNIDSVVGENIEFDGSDSFDPNGDTISYSWDFDDGFGSDQVAPVHAYSEVGNYLVSLTVSDGELSSSDFITVSISSAPVLPPPGGYPSGIIITEILPNPEGTDSEGEFIEIYNISNNIIDLLGWQLSDSTTSRYVFEELKIQPEEYLVFYREETGIALNNSGGDLVNIYHPDGEIVDSVEYSSSALEGKSYSFLETGLWSWTTPSPGASNASYVSDSSTEVKIDAPTQAMVNQEIEFDGSDSIIANGVQYKYTWDFGDGQNGEGISITHSYSEPGSYTVTLSIVDEYNFESTKSIVVQISDYDLFENILINEVMANVEGSDSDGEWIEIVNLENREVNLSGWKIMDPKTEYVFPENTLLGPGEYLVITRLESKITLNNSADSILLVNPYEEVINGVDYIKALEDISFSRKEFSDQWVWTEIATPGGANEIIEIQKQSNTENDEESDNISVTNIKTAKELAKGEYVQVTGWVTVEPGILASQKFYLMDQNSGIQIYSSKKDFPDISLGDYIQVVGKLSEASGEKKINIKEQNDIIILEPQEEIPEPAIAEIIDERFEGMLITIEGPIVEKKGTSFYVDYGGTEEVKVSIKSSTNIGRLDLEEGKMVQVTGIVSQSKDIYQILPRYQDDIIFPEVLGESSEMSNEETNIVPVDEKEEIMKYLFVAIIGVIVVIAGLLARRYGVFEKVKKIFTKTFDK